MSRPLCFALAAFVLAAGNLSAQEPAKDPADLPQQVFQAKFARITLVDQDRERLRYVTVQSVTEHRVRVRTVTVKNADGTTTEKPQEFAYQVQKPVFETHEQPWSKLTLTDLAGKRLDAAALAKPDLVGRQLLVIEDEVDPYYKKFLAAEVLLLRVQTE